VARIAKQGAEPGNLTLEQLAQFMKAETVKWSKAVKASGAKLE
jgi:tripartite-type tricarboxylate transporter receptor subunit TctC